MELTMDGDMIVRECLEKGVLINCTAGNVLRFIPPLIVQKKDVDRLIDKLQEVFKKVL
jgi:acetylornithine/N-succinyldiaminopimelate aminotransferase